MEADRRRRPSETPICRKTGRDAEEQRDAEKARQTQKRVEMQIHGETQRDVERRRETQSAGAAVIKLLLS